MRAIVAALCASLASVGCIDRHERVTKQMRWKCEGVAAMPERNLPRVEIAKLRFVDNPRYEERVSGPHLCTDLQAAGESTVSATFDVWGNVVFGLHGYNMTAIHAGSKVIPFYAIETSGYHDPGPHHGNFSSEQDRKQHPELYRFPLDVFR